MPDGTYATQSAITETVYAKPTGPGKVVVPPLRSLLLSGDFFLGAVLGASMTKLALKALDQEMDQVTKNLLVSQVSFFLSWRGVFRGSDEFLGFAYYDIYN